MDQTARIRELEATVAQQRRTIRTLQEPSHWVAMWHSNHGSVMLRNGDTVELDHGIGRVLIEPVSGAGR